MHDACSVRAAKDHHPIIRSIGAMLRNDAAFFDRLSAFVGFMADPKPAPDPVTRDELLDLQVRLDDALDRLAAVEARLVRKTHQPRKVPAVKSRACSHCGKTFSHTHPSARYCCAACRFQASKARRAA